MNNKNSTKDGSDFFENVWEESWTYIKTVVDVVREPVLILDKELKVMAANESFYRTFQVDHNDTEGKIVYQLGNGQWDIPALRKLLEDILRSNTFFKGFEVAHDFPLIGHKVMILNGRHIYFNDSTKSKTFPPIIMLAMEDVSEIMAIASTLATHTSKLESMLTERTKKLEEDIVGLEKKIESLKK